jgi:hypothetical protein
MSIISVKDNVADAIQWGLSQITVANGYNNTIASVYDPPVETAAMSNFPAINYYEGPDESTNVTKPGVHQQTGGNQAKLFNEFIVELDIYINVSAGSTIARKARNSVLADIQKYFGLHWNVPDQNGTPSAFNCMYLGSVPFGEQVNMPQNGCTVRFKVWYDQQLTDPTTRGYA